MIFILSGHTHDDDDEPHITEEVFFTYSMFHYHFPIELLIKELIKHEVFNESSFEIVHSLRPPRGVMDKLHYMMYRIGKKENGLKIFYQCLKETQDTAPSHGHAVSIMEHQGQ